MIELIEVAPTRTLTPDAYLSLPIDSRIKSRLKVLLDDGRDAGLLLPRGHILRGGTQLNSKCGMVVEIKAAPETVSSVYCQDAHLLTRIAYHLGNRHVPLQVESGWVRYQHDHVLDAMVEGLGARVTVEQAAFEPESGAYGRADRHDGGADRHDGGAGRHDGGADRHDGGADRHDGGADRHDSIFTDAVNTSL